MVNSILNSDINYPELKKLDSEDKSFDASMYEVNILGVDVVIALGQAKYVFIDDNIIYYPIYLVKDDKVSKQIGVYEIMSEQLPNIVDEDGDVDLTKIDEPLLYKFATNELLKEKAVVDKADTEQDDDQEEPSVEKEEEPSAEKADQDQTELPSADMAQMELERDAYKMDKEQPWIQEFLKSNEYQLIDNEGGGECLFAVIRDSFKSI